MPESPEETELGSASGKPKGAGLRRKIRKEEDLNAAYPERKWLTLLRMHYRPVKPVRVNQETTEPARKHGYYGDEMWDVGGNQMTKREAVLLAENLRCSTETPVWGTIDQRFGDSFLDDDEGEFI